MIFLNIAPENLLLVSSKPLYRYEKVQTSTEPRILIDQSVTFLGIHVNGTIRGSNMHEMDAKHQFVPFLDI